MEPEKDLAFEAAVQRAVHDQLAESRARRWRKLRVIFGKLGIGVCLFAIASVLIGGTLFQDTRTLAKEECQGSVAANLKNPGSASFSRVTAIENPKTVWTVSGTVRGTNSFGAIVPNTFTCLVFDIDGRLMTFNSKIE
mgnify:CR=1 FL=1